MFGLAFNGSKVAPKNGFHVKDSAQRDLGLPLTWPWPKHSSCHAICPTPGYMTKRAWAFGQGSSDAFGTRSSEKSILGTFWPTTRQDPPPSSACTPGHSDTPYPGVGLNLKSSLKTTPPGDQYKNQNLTQIRGSERKSQI